MYYVALVNTAHPKTGAICVGDVLTAEVMSALGREKLAELVGRGVLEERDENAVEADTAQTAPEAPASSDEPEAGEGGEEEAPEIGAEALEEIVRDDDASATKARKGRKRQ